MSTSSPFGPPARSRTGVGGIPGSRSSRLGVLTSRRISRPVRESGGRPVSPPGQSPRGCRTNDADRYGSGARRDAPRIDNGCAHPSPCSPTVPARGHLGGKPPRATIPRGLGTSRGRDVAPPDRPGSEAQLQHGGTVRSIGRGAELEPRRTTREFVGPPRRLHASTPTTAVGRPPRSGVTWRVVSIAGLRPCSVLTCGGSWTRWGSPPFGRVALKP